MPRKSEESLLQRVEKSLAEVAREATPKNVHFFRTSCRRLKAYARLAEGEPARVLRKLSKRLDRARQLAGRVRDLDVQLDQLRHLHVEAERSERRRLIAEMEEARSRAERKLAGELDQEAIKKLLGRVDKAKAAERAEGQHRRERRGRAGSRALELAAALPQDFPALDVENIHGLRLACKRIRYTAEQALPRPEAKRLVVAMKEVQDAVGRWHDWLILREQAEETLAPDSTLTRVLRSHERTSLAEALRRGREVTRLHVAAGEMPRLPRKANETAKSAKPDSATASAS
jgi:CHAD domain-containing protein